MSERPIVRRAHVETADVGIAHVGTAARPSRDGEAEQPGGNSRHHPLNHKCRFSILKASPRTEPLFRRSEGSRAY
jgi:hypothetical protein